MTVKCFLLARKEKTFRNRRRRQCLTNSTVNIVWPHLFGYLSRHSLCFRKAIFSTEVHWSSQASVSACGCAGCVNVQFNNPAKARHADEPNSKPLFRLPYRYTFSDHIVWIPVTSLSLVPRSSSAFLLYFLLFILRMTYFVEQEMSLILEIRKVKCK